MVECFSARTPHRSVADYLVVVAIALCALWLPPIAKYLLSGTLPELIIKAETPTNVIYGLDLGIIVPICIVGAVGMVKRRGFGYVLAGFVLGKATTMGLALLSMTWFAFLAGIEVELMLSVVWVVLFLSSTTMWIWLLYHCGRTT